MTVAERLRKETKALSWNRFVWAEHYYVKVDYTVYESLIIANYIFIDGSTLTVRLYTEDIDEIINFYY